MKKVILSLALLVSVATFAQKDELKTLKKIYAKSIISEKDLGTYKTASDALLQIATEKSDIVYANFYKTIYPTMVLASKGDKATLQDKVSLYTPEFIKEYKTVIDETIAFEKESGKNIYTNKIIEEKAQFTQGLKALALDYNKKSKYKEASNLFYNLYLFNPKEEGQSLENAAILATQAQDYMLAQKLYEEYLNSDYFNNGVRYYAVSKVSGEEELVPSKEMRLKLISLGTYEKPRDEKIVDKKPEILKTLALITTNNGNVAESKIALEKALKINPKDKDLTDSAFRLYFNEGYDKLKDDQKLVDEINGSRENKVKYDELMLKRKEIFKSALPNFEKAYQLKNDDANTKSLLKMSYEMLDMKDKAALIK